MENVTTEPVVQAQNEPITQVQEKMPEVDLLTKVGEFKKSQIKAQDNITNAPEQPEFESIKDPVAKEAAKQAVERLRRGFQSEFSKKQQDLTAQQQNLLQQSQNWSPERIQRELLNNPQFLEAARQIVPQNPTNSGLTDEQYSALTENEKNELLSLKTEVNSLKQSNYQAVVAQHDARLQQKFPDYNPTEIDNTIKSLSQMNTLDIREHVYKSLRHDEDVKAAYELGRQESKQINQEKISALSPSGTMTASSDGLPTREKNDTDQSWFVKLAQFRLAQSRKK